MHCVVFQRNASGLLGHPARVAAGNHVLALLAAVLREERALLADALVRFARSGARGLRIAHTPTTTHSEEGINARRAARRVASRAAPAPFCALARLTHAFSIHVLTIFGVAPGAQAIGSKAFSFPAGEALRLVAGDAPCPVQGRAAPAVVLVISDDILFGDVLCNEGEPISTRVALLNPRAGQAVAAEVDLAALAGEVHGEPLIEAALRLEDEQSHEYGRNGEEAADVAREEHGVLPQLWPLGHRVLLGGHALRLVAEVDEELDQGQRGRGTEHNSSKQIKVSVVADLVRIVVVDHDCAEGQRVQQQLLRLAKLYDLALAVEGQEVAPRARVEHGDHHHQVLDVKLGRSLFAAPRV